MILRCPACNTRYVVSAMALGDDGRKVRCVKCHHEWFQRASEIGPEGALARTTPAQPYQERPASQFPVTHTRIATPGWLKVATIALLLVTVGFGSVVFHEPLRQHGLESAYAAIGFPSSEGIRYKDLLVQPLPGRGSTRYFVQGYLDNTTGEAKEVPALRLALKNKDGKLLMQRDFVEEGAVLPPEEPKSFNNVKIEYRGNDAATLEVSLGNKLELSTR